jgi:long-chain acyl-CoA synthetase
MAAERPDQDALVCRLHRYTYREMQAAVEAGAAALHALGVREGDRVAATAPNQCDIMIAFLAVQRLGAIWVGASKQLASPELLFQLRNAGVSFFFGDSDALEKILAMGEEASFIRRMVDMEPGQNEWLRLIESHRDDPAPRVVIDPVAPAAIAYTSGTTGYPKGAVHCQHGLLAMAAHAAYRSPASGAKLRRGATLPLTILNLFVIAGLAAFAGGGTLVIMDRLDAVGVSEWIEGEGVESLTCSPPTVSDFISREDIRPESLASIQTLSCGGGPSPHNLRDGFLRKFGRPLYVTWGLTEAPTAVTGGFTSDCPSGSSGRTYDHLEVVVRGPDGAILPPGERGELCVRPIQTGRWAYVYTPMLGYWGHPEETRSALNGSELRTGDIGYLDPDGWLFVVDRVKSVIVRGGQNIYPAEVERVLKTHPDVTDAAVLAAPSERFGECALAAIEVAPGFTDVERLQSELSVICARELSKYKRPETWLFLTEFPRNPMMKINRALLRDHCLKSFGIQG